MLHDHARIHVQAGAGGDGCTSFRREAHVPRGGPDGGDGGRGGDVVVVCDDSLRDLQSFKRKAHYRAGRGGHGEGALRHGADGHPLTLRVPPGTEVSGPDGEGETWKDAAGSCSRTGSGPPSPGAGAAAGATSGSPPPRARRPASPSGACPARRDGSS